MDHETPRVRQVFVLVAAAQAVVVHCFETSGNSGDIHPANGPVVTHPTRLFGCSLQPSSDTSSSVQVTASAPVEPQVSSPSHCWALQAATSSVARAQFLSVVLSILFFAHPLNSMEALGIAMVFVALGAQIAGKWRGKGKGAKKPLPPTPPNVESDNAREHPDVDNPKAALLRASQTGRGD